jgi:hypothetical protein
LSELIKNVVTALSLSRARPEGRAEPSLCFWIVLRNRHQDPDPAHLIGLLPARRERPHRRAAEKTAENYGFTVFPQPLAQKILSLNFR